MSCANKLMSGGAGAADFAVQVYGNGNEQRAIAGSNLIAANNVAGSQQMGGNVFDALVNNNNGGNFEDGNLKKLMKLMKKSHLSKNEFDNIAMAGGSGVLENVAVPAILLYLNQKVKSKGKKSVKFHRNHRKSRKNRN